MQQVSVIIPNYNGVSYLETCLNALDRQTYRDFLVILVDNGSTDDSVDLIRKKYTWVNLVILPENFGFCRAVNEGIRAADTPYVVLLNNDTEVFPDFIEQLLKGIEKRPEACSCAAKMIQAKASEKLDDAGDFYNALGWAFARGKGKSVELYEKSDRIFAACAGAAIYRTECLKEIGLMDEEHFAYLEDIDLGYRARIYGYENWYLPKARVYHVGSGTSGSRYNTFKTQYSSRNNVYLIYKNMPLLQWLLNLPFLIVGFGLKTLFFIKKGYGKEYLAGIKSGCSLCLKADSRKKKVRFRWKHFGNYCRIQLELWMNLFRKLL